MDMPQLRPALDADVPFLLALRRETMDEHYLASGVEPSDEEHRERLFYRFDCAQIIELDGVPAGLFKVARDGQAWELIQIQLARSAQGKGLGRVLIRALIDESREAGLQLKLSVLRGNPARQLYEQLGFRVVGESAHSYEMLHAG